MQKPTRQPVQLNMRELDQLLGAECVSLLCAQKKKDCGNEQLPSNAQLQWGIHSEQ